MILSSIPRRYQTPAAALFALLLGAAWLMAWGWRMQASESVVERELQRSIAVATSLSNTLWPRYLEQLRSSVHVAPAEIGKLEFLESLGQDTANQVRGQRVQRVKIYDARGVTLFSTEQSQIGRDESGNPAVQEALRGQAKAMLVQAEEGRGASVSDVVEAFVPARPGASGMQEAVFEVHADVSGAMADVRSEERQVFAIANLAGLIIFGVALMILRRAEEIQRRKDPITGLPGREPALEAMANAAKARRGSPTRHVGWLIVELQRLRQVSAAYGQDLADDVMREAAQRLKALAEGEARLFRLAGEGFAILVEDGSNTDDQEDVAQRLALEVRARFESPIERGGHSIAMDPSMGIALARPGEVNSDELLNRAEVSLTEAKRQGSGHWMLYTPGLETGVRERLQSLGGLRNALAARQFLVYYQPLVDARTHELKGSEALVRWHHPTRGLVSPDLFIPLLEETGLIVDVGMYVLREACRQAVAWRASLCPDFTVSVNLSARQFADPDLISRVHEVLSDTGLPPKALIIEVTETFLAWEPEHAASTLREFRKLGVAVAVDDFGVGYSSLSSLRHLPVDILKIDRTFISNAPNDPMDASIARAIAALAQGLNLSLVAEGVENEAQATFARSVGCHKLQGFLFSRPLDAASFAATYGNKV
jgi:diguanylate cyclase (GGDEF)-like protein